jgi:hypothetical protein
MNINDIRSNLNILNDKINELFLKIDDINNYNLKKSKCKKINEVLLDINNNLKKICFDLEDDLLEIDNICIKDRFIIPSESKMNEIHESIIDMKVYKKFLLPMLIYKHQLLNS